MKITNGSGKNHQSIRIAATNGKEFRDLYWVNIRKTEIQCGLSAKGYPRHTSLHESGEKRISKENVNSELEIEAPAIGQVVDKQPEKIKSINQLTGIEDLDKCVLFIDDNSLKDYPIFTKKKKHDSVVYVDVRCFHNNVLSLDTWVSPPGHFHHRMPKPPGFRTIFEFPWGWFIIHIGDN